MTRPKVDPDKRQRTAQACDSCKRRKQKVSTIRARNIYSKLCCRVQSCANHPSVWTSRTAYRFAQKTSLSNPRTLWRSHAALEYSPFISSLLDLLCSRMLTLLIKCNGSKPCNTCSKRGSTCMYGESSNESDEQPSPKRRAIDRGGDAVTSPVNGSQHHINLQYSNAQQSSSQELPQWVPILAAPLEVPDTLQPHESSGTKAPIDTPAPLFLNPTGDDRKDTINHVDQTSHLLSQGSTVSGQDEVADVYSNTRMLQDPTGRLLYVGDSATLSFLQLIRMIVDNVAGPSPFTMDPRRHRIVENTISLPANIRRTHLLPDRQTANVLVDAFFTNTNGVLKVFNRTSFLNTLDVCYADPLNIDPSWLCLLYLSFAIGLVAATPRPGTPEDAIIRKLRAEPVDRAELFYSDAKHLSDPLAGFEDAGFWSIQALTLMSLYMLIVSKRNAAYALFGMAVRSAFALGLHREETMCIFSGAEQSIRRNLWRSLYVLDRFLSASLGRPTSIRESDCSGDTLTTGEKPPFPQAPFPTAANAGFTGTLGLEASVRSCHVIGVILEKTIAKAGRKRWIPAYTGDKRVRYFLFASALIVLSNEFSALFQNGSAASCITNAINIMHYLAQLDPQANRLLFILTAFRDVAVRQNATTSQSSNPAIHPHLPPQRSSRATSKENIKPIGDPYIGRTSADSSTIPATAGQPAPHKRHGSSSGISPTNPLPSLINPIDSDAPNHNYHPEMKLAQSPSSNKTRQNSLDTFLDLARVSSNSSEAPGYFGGGEIDFEMLWQWPNANSTGLTPSSSGKFAADGVGVLSSTAPFSTNMKMEKGLENNEHSHAALNTPKLETPDFNNELSSLLYLDSESADCEILAVGLTPGGNIGIATVGGQGLGGLQQVDVQGISDSSVPLFGMSNPELSGS
ncbi:Filamentous growth regulator 27 [Hyphodiscus hymeniophilus]|uniref:Filamentous growth regulator 27 n=1 Tax=Hyphodiscus hymeniophilus TaxID=353542 RepID=A0A9P7AUH2_9HELO|nr:Filamentous growth regulator 27 [Hyphodiscus hymeniophilus]